MTDANPFDDLSDVCGESEQETEVASDTSSETSTTNATDAAESTTGSESPKSSMSSVSSESSNSSQTSSDPVSGPSFDYSEVRQRPLYARGETWDEFEDAIGISVVPELRRQGIRDEEKREIHDAVLTLAAEEPERLVEIITERRER